MLDPESGKTTLLTAIAKTVPHTNALYMAFNKSIATEAQRKFPNTTKAVTTHALAYRAIVVPNKYRIGTFNFRTITERIRYEQKCILVDDVREFCLSKYTCFTEFCTANELPNYILELGNKYLSLMESGKIDCTHEFYLKLFHMQLANGELEYEPFDFIMLDEAGDLNEVTLEIFKLLPSKLKIAVGDPYQNIYTFNHTINCFEVLKDEGKLFHMSTSFRVNDSIAKRIQAFCQRNLDPSMQFKGIETDQQITTMGYLTRTNSALIDKMIDLNSEQTPYGLLRKASEIFKLPLMLASIKYQHYISDPQYKHLQSDFDDWHEDPQLKELFKSPLAYIASLYPDDFQLTQAIRLISKHGKSKLFETYTEASKHESRNHNIILATSHSSKGMEYDEVVIDSGLNDMVIKTLEDAAKGDILEDSIQYRDAMNLYYVACSRAKKKLTNAIALDY